MDCAVSPGFFFFFLVPGFNAGSATCWDSQVVQWSRVHLPMQETWVLSLGREYHLEEKMATHSSILALEIPWTEQPGGLQSMGVTKELDMTQQQNNNCHILAMIVIGD